MSWNGVALCHRVAAAGDVSVAGASPGGGAEHPTLALGHHCPWGNDKSARAMQKSSPSPQKLLPYATEYIFCLFLQLSDHLLFAARGVWEAGEGTGPGGMDAGTRPVAAGKAVLRVK